MARRFTKSLGARDPAFAAEMKALADARRAEHAGRTGDGMAVVAPRFMDFPIGAQRVPPPEARRQVV